MNFTSEITILNQTASSAAFTVANATDIFTSAAHGLSNGDIINVANSGGALPTGLSASTNYFIITATTNTFQVSTTVGGSAVDMSDDGSGTNTWYLLDRPAVIDVSSYSTAIISVSSADSVDLVLKFAGAISDTAPDFFLAQSTTNRYDFLDLIDREDLASIDGDTGFDTGGTDLQRVFQLDVRGLKWLSARTLDFVIGTLVIKCKLFI